MTTLDPIDAVLDKLTIESAKELGNGYMVYARGMAYVIDAVRAALSSLPAQAVGVKMDAGNVRDDLTRLVAARDWTDHYPSVWVADVAKRALEVIPDEDMKNEQ